MALLYALACTTANARHLPILAVYALWGNIMTIVKHPAVANHLLAGLPAKSRKALLRSCETVDLEVGHIVCEAGKPNDHVYFPLSGFLSMVAPATGHPPLETRLIGNEGMLGCMLVLGIQQEQQRVVVQGSCTALRLSTDQFCKALEEYTSLSDIINRYLYVLVEQLTQTVACNRFHDVEQRLARRLLMTHDRVQGDDFHLTHQLLADMLGVLRSAVTIAASALQLRGLIHYSRGDISILDRFGLEASACECYAIGIGDYDKLIV